MKPVVALPKLHGINRTDCSSTCSTQRDTTEFSSTKYILTPLGENASNFSKFHDTLVGAVGNDCCNTNFLPILIKIREQNTQILNLLKGDAGEVTSNEFNDKLPIKSMEDIYFINNEIKNNNDKWKSLVSCLASLGGDTVVSRTNRILKHLITDSVAKGFNFRGRNDKAAFNILEFYKIIIYVVKSKINTAQEIDIEQAIKNWLKHAPQREKVRNNKAENQV